MKRRSKLARLMTCLVAASVVLAFAVSPVFAEDATDPGTDPGTGDDTEPPAEEPVPFSVCGVVVAYEIPGVITQLPDGDSDDGEDVDEELAEDEEEVDEQSPEDEEEVDEQSPEDEEEVDEEPAEITALEEPADPSDTTDSDETDSDETDSDETDSDETDSDETESDEPTDFDEPVDTEESAEPEEPAPGVPFITVSNETGEYTYEVAADAVISAPQAETGEYIINVGDLAQVSGVDNVVDHITITPAANPGTRSSYAAVPGVVEAIAPTDIIVKAADGFTYSFVITEATVVYAGPLTVSVADITVGAHVVVKGDGAGNAKWIRFTGQSSKAVRHQYRHREYAPEAAGQNGGHGNGGGNGRGNGQGNGNGRGNGHGNGHQH